MKCADLSESILQRTDGLTGRVSREADLLPLLKGPGGNPVQVSVANPTSEAGRSREVVKHPNGLSQLFHTCLVSSH